MNQRDFNHRDWKLEPDGARMTIGARITIALTIISQEDGATCGTSSAQWRQPVTMTRL